MSSNTFCLELCHEDYTTYAEKHRQEVLTALLYIKENLPRTMVNLVISPSKSNWILKKYIILLKLITYKKVQTSMGAFLWKINVGISKLLYWNVKHNILFYPKCIHCYLTLES